MSARRIDQFFTPSPSVKRQRSSSSPTLSTDSDAMDQKVGELTQAQLMAALNNLLDQKLSKLATKEDLTNLSLRIDALEDENRRLRDELCLMKKNEVLVRDKLVDLESRSRRNNLIFKGLKVPEESSNYCQVVKTFCMEVLGSRSSLWVNRAHPLGRDRTTIIAHLPDDADLQHVMSKVSTLRNTGYVVHRDFPREVREKRANLVKVRSEVERATGRRKMPLVHDHLTIEGCRFTWTGGKLRAGPKDGGERLRELVGHDFTEFLTGLQQGDGDRGDKRGAKTTSSVTGLQGGSAGQ